MIPMYVDDIIQRALLEDINYVDAAADYLLPDDQMGTGRFLAKADGVLCGLEECLRVFTLLDPSVTFQRFQKDGDLLQKGDYIAAVTGPVKTLLKGERTALNLIQHLSGIATETHRCVELVAGTRAQITDTRKTLPGLRALQKYAVTCGGGKNHRFNLSDAAMLKDNHIDAAGGITAALQTIRGKLGHMTKVEVETRNLEEVREALDAGADVIMLDNMDLETMRQAVAMANGKVPLEASGGITAETIRAVAETGVDIISLGALTHSVKAFDISMKIK